MPTTSMKALNAASATTIAVGNDAGPPPILRQAATMTTPWQTPAMSPIGSDSVDAMRE